MGQLVVRFERLGLVKTSSDPSDARAKRVELSKRGHKLIIVTHRFDRLARFDVLAGRAFHQRFGRRAAQDALGLVCCAFPRPRAAFGNGRGHVGGALCGVEGNA